MLAVFLRPRAQACR